MTEKMGQGRGRFIVMELCKDFAEGFRAYAETNNKGDDASKTFIKYASAFHNRRGREGLLSDARSIAPVSLADFDKDKLLLNCSNGTFSFRDFGLRPHRPEDFITKMTKVKFDHTATCPRWERFISEVMCGDADTAVFLQKTLGYAE